MPSDRVLPQPGTPTSTETLDCAFGCACRRCTYEKRLFTENVALREEVQAIHIRSIPDDSSPGYDIWQALMEDLRAEGRIRLAVRNQSVVSISYEPMTAVFGPEDAERNKQ